MTWFLRCPFNNESWRLIWSNLLNCRNRLYVYIYNHLGAVHKLCTYTVSKNLSGHSSVCYKTSLNTGGVGQAGNAPPTSKLEKFLSWPLALSMSIYSNFQINGASGGNLKPPDPRFLKQNGGSGGFRVSPEAPFIWKLL